MTDPLRDAISTEILGSNKISGLKAELAALKEKVPPNALSASWAEMDARVAEAGKAAASAAGASDTEAGGGEVPTSSSPPAAAESYDNTPPRYAGEEHLRAHEEQWVTDALQHEQAKGEDADPDYVTFLQDQLAGLKAVTETSMSVQVAANAPTTPDLTDRINAAKSPAEVQAIMAEAGLAE